MLVFLSFCMVPRLSLAHIFCLCLYPSPSLFCPALYCFLFCSADSQGKRGNIFCYCRACAYIRPPSYGDRGNKLGVATYENTFFDDCHGFLIPVVVARNSPCSDINALPDPCIPEVAQMRRLAGISYDSLLEFNK